MDDTNKGVETISPVAPVENPGVEKNDPVAPAESDLSIRLKTLEEENTRLQQEKENYRRGLLAAKGKNKEDEFNPYVDPTPQPDIEELVKRTVQEQLMASREAQIAREKESLLQEALRREAELRRALQNRPAEPIAPGSNSEQPAPAKDNFFTPEQIAHIKSKGLDPEVVKRNMGASAPSPL